MKAPVRSVVTRAAIATFLALGLAAPGATAQGKKPAQEKRVQLPPGHHADDGHGHSHAEIKGPNLTPEEKKAIAEKQRKQGLEKQRLFHDARRRAVLKRIRAGVGDPGLKEVPTQLRQELKKHAQRMAALRRIQALARRQKDDATLKKANTLADQEVARHDRAMHNQYKKLREAK